MPEELLRSLRTRGAPLAEAAAQRTLLGRAPIPEFVDRLAEAGLDLRPAAIEVLQVNLGKLCNMACRHCHVDAGPDRVRENMDEGTVGACLALLDRTTAHTVDITGGAPELHPHFRYLVEESVRRQKHVIDRSNLTVFLLERCADLPAWLGERGVEIVASLPHWRKPQTDAQRGVGTFERSIEAIRRLNAVGYGTGDPRRRLTLMHNPAGAFLPGRQAALEKDWRAGLARTQGVRFDRLIALTNMPISRYLEWLEETGNLEAYLALLVRSFNPDTISGLMCRNTLSVGWDGRIYDCDFNQMLELESAVARATVHDVEVADLLTRPIRTGRHCFGCTAGAGSSCGGATSAS